MIYTYSRAINENEKIEWKYYVVVSWGLLTLKLLYYTYIKTVDLIKNSRTEYEEIFVSIMQLNIGRQSKHSYYSRPNHEAEVRKSSEHFMALNICKVEYFLFVFPVNVFSIFVVSSHCVFPSQVCAACLSDAISPKCSLNVHLTSRVCSKWW